MYVYPHFSETSLYENGLACAHTVHEKDIRDVGGGGGGGREG